MRSSPTIITAVNRFFAFICIATLLCVDSKAMGIVLNNPMLSVVLDPKKMDCMEKTQGVGGGKVCTIDKERYMLKANEQLPGQIFTPSMIDGYNNLQLFRKFGVITPDVNFVFEHNGYYVMDGKKVRAEAYIASRFVEGFRTANDFIKKAVSNYEKHHRKNQRTVFAVTKKEYLRSEILKNIGGEAGLAQLAVIGTLAYDIVNNNGNWGSQNGKFVVVDADLSPQTRIEYLELAKKMPHDINIDLSLTTLKKMRAIYSKLLLSAEEDATFSVLTLSEYIHLMIGYVNACDEAISTLEAADAETANQPGFVNDILGLVFQKLFTTSMPASDR